MTVVAPAVALAGRRASPTAAIAPAQSRRTQAAREKILAAASGLTLGEAENVFAKTLVVSGRLSDEDLPIILSEKEQTIRKSGLLEYYHADADLEQVGGMDVLKDWLEKRRVAFEPEAAGHLVEGMAFHEFYFRLGGGTAHLSR